MATHTTSSCTGSTILQPISDMINLPLDQVNFVVSQLFALLTAVWFRLYLHPSKTSPFIRHVVATLLGFYLALFCFGWYALHFLVQSGLSYSIMVFTSLEHMHNSMGRAPVDWEHDKGTRRTRRTLERPAAVLLCSLQANTGSALGGVVGHALGRCDWDGSQFILVGPPSSSITHDMSLFSAGC